MEAWAENGLAMCHGEGVNGSVPRGQERDVVGRTSLEGDLGVLGF